MATTQRIPLDAPLRLADDAVVSSTSCTVKGICPLPEAMSRSNHYSAASAPVIRTVQRKEQLGTSNSSGCVDPQIVEPLSIQNLGMVLEETFEIVGPRRGQASLPGVLEWLKITTSKSDTGEPLLHVEAQIRHRQAITPSCEEEGFDRADLVCWPVCSPVSVAELPKDPFHIDREAILGEELEKSREEVSKIAVVSPRRQGMHGVGSEVLIFEFPQRF